MRCPEDMLPGSFARRLGRFTAEVDLDGELMPVYVADSGRIQDRIAPSSPVWLRRVAGAARVTRYDLALAKIGRVWVAADSRLPNLLVRGALAAGRIQALRSYSEVRPEARLGDCRIDFLLTGPGGRCWLEVKAVSLVQGDSALFPDAKTSRGVRQIAALAQAHARGDAACVLFIVQREDARELRPNAAIDPGFARSLREAAARGVQVLAYRCRVSPCAIELADAISVVL